MSDENRKLDIDSVETKEWVDALATVLREDGTERAKFLLEQLQKEAAKAGIDVAKGCNTAYINTIPTNQEKQMPNDDGAGARLAALIRWNAIAMVLRATKKNPELGGHIATYASAATLY